MKIALATPYHLDVPGGNTTAVKRLEHEFQALGHEVSVFFAGDELPITGRFDIVHGFHAMRGGEYALKAAKQLGVPAVVTLTGTDVNIDLLDEETRPAVLRSLSMADGVIALHEDQLVHARERSGMALNASEVIYQSIAVGHQRYRFRTLNGFSDDQFVVLLPAGLRRVKALHLALEAQRLRDVDEPEWELALVGPILDDAYASELLDRMEHFPSARWCGPISPECMGACYDESDVVLNTSDSEGICNSILEAQLSGVPVLARKNLGNQSLVKHEEDGLLFSSSVELARSLCRLQRDGALRERLSKAGRQRAKAYPSPREEALRHLALYGRLIQ